MVRKRKTQSSGTFSVASWVLFVGLFSAWVTDGILRCFFTVWTINMHRLPSESITTWLIISTRLIYQVIARRSIEVYRVRRTNAPDLLSFVSDMEFNITTISSMSCSHLRGLNQLVVGMPGSIYFKVSPLSTYTNYTCYNFSRGPTVSLKCTSRKVPIGDHYISWQFVDLPDDPATAVGFQLNLTAKAHGDDRHLSYVGGTFKVGSSANDRPQTFRGQDMNVLNIHLFPQKFTYLHNLGFIQPLLHDFLPWSSFSEVGDLQASLQNLKDGLVNTTLYISYLSDYIVEIDKQNVVGIGTTSYVCSCIFCNLISHLVHAYLLEATYCTCLFDDAWYVNLITTSYKKIIFSTQCYYVFTRIVFLSQTRNSLAI